MARAFAPCFAALLVSACAAPPLTAPSVAGKPAAEVSKLVAASEAKPYPCSIVEVKSATGAVDLGGFVRPEVTLPPGRYVVTMKCASPYHSFSPKVDVAARPGRTYRLTGYLIDDSITIFNMKMAVKVMEQSQ
jgi:hypothetical protein